RLAEAGGTAHELMAISGHRTLSEVQRYTEDANRKLLADTGMAKKRTPGEQASGEPIWPAEPRACFADPRSPWSLRLAHSADGWTTVGTEQGLSADVLRGRLPNRRSLVSGRWNPAGAPPSSEGDSGSLLQCPFHGCRTVAYRLLLPSRGVYPLEVV